MLCLGFDTETTGLPNKFKPINDDCQPDIVQICMKLFDMEKIYASISLLVIPGQTISPKSQEIHGVSHDLVNKAGVSRRVMVAMFNNFVKLCDLIVCHNVGFDLPRIKTAYHREGISTEILDSKPTFCTMIESTQLVGIRNDKGLKWPTLQEAYKFFIDPNGFENAHDAEVDVNAMIPIFRAIKNGNRAPSNAA